MDEKIMLGDFIYKLRREAGLTQSELGDKLGVSNKAVSKWETNEANPELNLIPKLAAILGVTCDELLASEKKESESDEEKDRKAEGKKNGYCFMGCMKGTSVTEKNGYEFISEACTSKGTPYLHINIGGKKDGKVRQANGIVAIGTAAKGIVSVGLLSMGVFSVGLLSLGIFTVGLIALGLIAVGIVALGGAVTGVVAIGIVAVGAVAVGYLSVGAVSIGAYAYTGISGYAIGWHTFYK